MDFEACMYELHNFSVGAKTQKIKSLNLKWPPPVDSLNIFDRKKLLT